MTIKKEFTEADIEYIRQLQDAVNSWARKNVPNEYNYNSRMTYWGSARTAGIISNDEYELAKSYFGPLWDYVGD